MSRRGTGLLTRFALMDFYAATTDSFMGNSQPNPHKYVFWFLNLKLLKRSVLIAQDITCFIYLPPNYSQNTINSVYKYFLVLNGNY